MQRGNNSRYKKGYNKQQKQSSLFESSTKSQGVRKLFIKWHLDVTSDFTNLHDWLKDWWKVKIGTYGQEYQDIMINGIWDIETLEQKLAKHETQELKPVAKEFWLPTEEEETHLKSITNQEDRGTQRNKYFVKWADERIISNSVIRNNNNKIENLRKWITDNHHKNIDQHLKIFTDMYATIEAEGQKYIDGYICRVSELNLAKEINGILGEKRSESEDLENGDEDFGDEVKVAGEELGAGDAGGDDEDDKSSKSVAEVINFYKAKQTGNWIWLLKAAIDTHTKVVKSENTIENRKRIRDAENRVKNWKYEGGPFHGALAKYEDKVKTVEQLGGFIEELDKIYFLLMGLPRDLFGSMLNDYENPRIAKDAFPKKFYPMLAEVRNEYSRLCLKKGSLVADYLRRGSKKSEQSFKSTEGKSTDGKKSNKSGKMVCEICDKNHATDDCPSRNKNFSVKANRGYYERVTKREKADAPSTAVERKESKPGAESSKATDEDVDKSEDESSKWAGKGTVARKPSGKEVSFVLNEILAEEYDTELCLACDNYITEYSNATRIRELPEEIDFVYDTGTVSGIIKPTDSGVLTDVKRDPTRIVGVGGAESMLALSGQTTFGKMRILNSNNEKNLISHIETENIYQIIHPRKGLMILKEWEVRTGKQWYLYPDIERFGDPLYHLVVSRIDYPLLMASARVKSEMSLTMYQPNYVPSTDKLTDREVASINKVDRIHRLLNHASAGAIMRTIKSEEDNNLDAANRLGITTAEVQLWEYFLGKHCTGCLQGKMKDHDRVPSTAKRDYKLGEVATGDLLFVEVSDGNKVPGAVHADIVSKYIIDFRPKYRDVESMLNCIKHVKGVYKSYGHDLKEIIYDRESSIVALEANLQELGMRVTLKAAGQKSGLAEYTIGMLRNVCRATKNGVWDKFGYKPPVQWNFHLLRDSINCVNRIVRPGFSKSPSELFTGIKLDPVRDLRIEWGEIVIVKKAKRASADLDSAARWGVCVYRYPNSSGVIMFYIVETKRFVHAIKFMRATPPRRIIQDINNISPNEKFTFDESGEFLLNNPSKPITNRDNIEEISDGEESDSDDEELPSDLNDALEEAEQTEGNVEYISDKVASKQRFVETYKKTMLDEDPPVASDIIITDVQPDVQPHGDPYYQPDVGETPPMVEEPEVRRSARLSAKNKGEVPAAAGPYVTRSSRVSKPPERLSYPVQYKYEEIYIMFEQAVKSNRAKDAVKALDKELDSITDKGVFHGILESSLDKEQKARIIRSMVNYIEKYTPEGVFDKAKVRMLIRGDQQWDFGDTSSPVCRVESVFLIANIAILEDLEVVKLDFTSAFLNSDMVDSVKHQWVILPRVIARKLIERDRDEWMPFVRADGTILVRMDKVMYGYKEASLQWFLNVCMMMAEGDFLSFNKDLCFFYKILPTVPRQMMLIATTVDDKMIAVSRGSEMKQDFYDLCKKFFQKFTIEEGDTINIIGMTFVFDRVNKLVTVTQKGFVEKLVTAQGVTKKAVTPGTEDLYDEDPASPLLKDQIKFMSLNASCNWPGNRTYPEILPVTTYLSGRYRKATEADEKKALRVVEFLNYNRDHCLCLCPRSYNIVAYADASYAEHADGKSRTGGCIGFEGPNGNPSLWVFVSSKQPVIPKSSCEAELIAASTVCDNVVWLQETLEILGLKGDKPATLYQDNKSAIQMEKNGHGTFKRAKHIKVRWFWIKDLVDLKLIVIEYLCTDEMIADVLTKPVLGSKFRYFQAKLLGWYNLPKKETLDEETVEDEKYLMQLRK